jgi:hypothetical protein
MRKESLKIARAFAEGLPATAARTMTDGNALYLHGHRIAQREPDGRVWFTLAGWPTRTTRDRLNTLAHVLGIPVRIYQRGHHGLIDIGGVTFPMFDHDRYEVRGPRPVDSAA